MRKVPAAAIVLILLSAVWRAKLNLMKKSMMLVVCVFSCKALLAAEGTITSTKTAGSPPDVSSATATAVIEVPVKKKFGAAFYDEDGKSMEWIKRARPQRAKSWGDYLVARSEGRLINIDSEGISCFNDMKALVWSKSKEELGLVGVHSWTLNYSGSRVLIVDGIPDGEGNDEYHRWLVLDENGRIIFEKSLVSQDGKPAEGPWQASHAIISPNGRYVGFPLWGNEFRLIDLVSKDEWKMKASLPVTARLRGLDNTGSFIIHDHPRVILYSRSGEIIKKIDLKDRPFNTGLKYSPDGTLILE